MFNTQAAARRHGKEAGAGRSLLAADIAEPAAVDRTRKRSSDSAVALAAAAASSDNAAAAAAEPQKEETVVKPKKVKEVGLCWGEGGPGVMFDSVPTVAAYYCLLTRLYMHTLKQPKPAPTALIS